MTIQVTNYTYKLQTTDTATSRPHCPKRFMPQESIAYIHYNPSYILYISDLRSQIRSDLTVARILHDRHYGYIDSENQ